MIRLTVKSNLAILGGAGGQLGRVALGVREGIGQRGEPASAFRPGSRLMPPGRRACRMRAASRQKALMYRSRASAAQAAVCGVHAPCEHDAEHALVHAQGLQVRRDHGERRQGDAGVAQVLVPDLGADADDLRTPGTRVGLQELDLAAQASDEQVVQGLLVDDVGVQRRGAGTSPSGRRIVSAAYPSRETMPRAVSRMASTVMGCLRPAEVRDGVALSVGERLLVPRCAPALRRRSHGHI